MATKKKEKVILIPEQDIIKLESLVEDIHQSLAAFNELIVELNEDFEDVHYNLFDEDGNEVSMPTLVHITKTWSN